MILTLEWYDFIPYVTIGIATGISLVVIWLKEGCRTWDDGTTKNKKKGGSNCDGYVSFSQLWTSCWSGVKPTWLLALRLLCAIIMVSIQAYDISQNGIIIFVFYTIWTFSLVTVYFVYATIVSAYGIWKNGKETGTRSDEEINFGGKLLKHSDKEESEEKAAGFWGYLMQIIFQTCAGAVILTDLTFWIILYPTSKDKITLLTVLDHSVNLVFLTLETLTNNLPFPWFRMGYFVLWTCTYINFQWYLHACGVKEWPYFFLDLSSKWAPLCYGGFALLLYPLYHLFGLILLLKRKLLN